MTTVTIEKIIKKLNYGNSFYCRFTENVTGEIEKYVFLYNNQLVYYIPPIYLNDFKNTHWSEHHLLLKKIPRLNKKGLLEFENFASLYYVGCAGDGMLKNIISDKFISTPIRFDYHWFVTHLNIISSENYCKKMVDRISNEYITANVVEIPFDELPEDTIFNYTIEIIAKLENSLYNMFIGNNEFVNDEVKKNICTYFKIDFPD